MSENQGNGDTQESHVQILNNLAGKFRWGIITYEYKDKTLKDNTHLWTVIARLDEKPYGKGCAPTKAQAKDIAAQNTLEAFKLEGRYTPTEAQAKDIPVQNTLEALEDRYADNQS